MTQDTKEGIKDVKPSVAQMRAAKKKGALPPPEGRIGTLVVMKSGKVKMVLGDGIVMDVSLTPTFDLQEPADMCRSVLVYPLLSCNSSYTSTPRPNLLLFSARSTRITWLHPTLTVYCKISSSTEGKLLAIRKPRESES
jgi:hypothetical protein